MLIIKYKLEHHNSIIKACVHALAQGKTVAYPTDTSYGLAADPKSKAGIQALYKIKQREKGQPVHVIPPTNSYAKKIAHWSKTANKLAAKFWPGPLSLILELKSGSKMIKQFCGKGTTIGFRQPNNKIALDLAKILGRPIPATSANPSHKKSGGYDCYKVKDIIDQFNFQKNKPDIIIDAGKLPKRKPSTMVKVYDDIIEIIRPGPVSADMINRALNDS